MLAESLAPEAVQPFWIVRENRAPGAGVGNHFDEDVQQFAGVEVAVGKDRAVVDLLARVETDVWPVGAPDEALGRGGGGCEGARCARSGDGIAVIISAP